MGTLRSREGTGFIEHPTVIQSQIWASWLLDLGCAHRLYRAHPAPLPNVSFAAPSAQSEGVQCLCTDLSPTSQLPLPNEAGDSRARSGPTCLERAACVRSLDAARSLPASRIQEEMRETVSPAAQPELTESGKLFRDGRVVRIQALTFSTLGAPTEASPALSAPSSLPPPPPPPLWPDQGCCYLCPLPLLGFSCSMVL